MEQLAKQILKISYELGLSHIGSCLSVLPILEEIYAKKKPEDKVQLCGAHSHLAHLVVKSEGAITWVSVGDLIKWHGIHCERKAGCDVSGGSLGHGGISLGMAIANPDITVYLIETDGALNEGSCWEVLKLKQELNVDNLTVIVNMNGYTALGEVNKDYLTKRLKAFCPSIDIRYTNNGLPELEGVKGHYLVLK